MNHSSILTQLILSWCRIQQSFPLLEKKDRTEDDTEKMIAMAYASTLHWSSYSKHSIANRARGEYMISTALAYAEERNKHFIMQSELTILSSEIRTRWQTSIFPML